MENAKPEHIRVRVPDLHFPRFSYLTRNKAKTSRVLENIYPTHYIRPLYPPQRSDWLSPLIFSPDVCDVLTLDKVCLPLVRGLRGLSKASRHSRSLRNALFGKYRWHYHRSLTFPYHSHSLTFPYPSHTPRSFHHFQYASFEKCRHLLFEKCQHSIDYYCTVTLLVREIP